MAYIEIHNISREKKNGPMFLAYVDVTVYFGFHFLLIRFFNVCLTHKGKIFVKSKLY